MYRPNLQPLNVEIQNLTIVYGQSYRFYAAYRVVHVVVCERMLAASWEAGCPLNKVAFFFIQK